MVGNWVGQKINIGQIKAASARDYLRGNRYRVSINNPITGSLDPNSSTNCNAVDFPGMSFGTFDRRQKGPLLRLPNDRITTEVNFSFYMDGNASARKYFQGWFDGIYDTNDQFRFFDDYKGNARIEEFNRQGQTVYSAELQDCYPLILNATNLSYDQNSSVEIFTCSLLAYRVKVS